MAERKAVNKYYPPDWTPNKGSINKYVGQHPLRERARKLGQGILVIRFELPYNIWCGGCGAHVGMGVRYNAEKKKVGSYYSTPIYRFRMKCHLCDNYFEIETDPKNCDYNVVSGARRKNERWEASATETVETTDKEDAKRMAIDAMFKLEHGVEDVQKAKKVAPALNQLQEVQSVWRDDYSANKLLRKKFREEKKVIKDIKESDDQLRKKGSLDIPLVPEADEDVEKAKKTKFFHSGFDAHKKKNRTEIASRSWFGTDAISTVSAKIPGISLRKRKSNSSDDPKDDWKKSVRAKSSKSETSSNAKGISRHSEEEKLQAMEVTNRRDDLGFNDENVEKRLSNLAYSCPDSEEQGHTSSSTEKDNNLNYSHYNNDRSQATNQNSLRCISIEKEQLPKVSIKENNICSSTSSSTKDTSTVVKGTDSSSKSGDFSTPSSDSVIPSFSLVSAMYSDSETSGEDS